MNTTEKYWWVYHHPQFNKYAAGSVVIELTPHMVNPCTNRIDYTGELNTKQQWWVELMHEDYLGAEDGYQCVHDWKLDCGGDTIDEVIDELYNLTLKEYGDYEVEM